MIDFSYQDGNSLLHRADPALKIAGTAACTILILSFHGLPGLVISSVLLSVLIFSSGLPSGSVFRPLRRMLFFLCAIFLMNAFFTNDGHCLVSAGFVCLSLTGVTRGLDIVRSIAAVTLLSVILIRTTPSVGIMRGIEKLMRPLRALGVPTRDIALIMSIALQFIPVFFADFERIRKAQTVRGADFSGGSLKERAVSVFPLVIPAFISAFRRADELSAAIEARGYRGENKNSEL